jgi:hypothetical protein
MYIVNFQIVPGCPANGRMSAFRFTQTSPTKTTKSAMSPMRGGRVRRLIYRLLSKARPIRTHFINRRARVCTRIGAGKGDAGVSGDISPACVTARACKPVRALQGGDASRSGSTRKERNAVQRRFWCKPFGKVVWTAHCSVAPLAQGPPCAALTLIPSPKGRGKQTAPFSPWEKGWG